MSFQLSMKYRHHYSKELETASTVNMTSYISIFSLYLKNYLRATKIKTQPTYPFPQIHKPCPRPFFFGKLGQKYTAQILKHVQRLPKTAQIEDKLCGRKEREEAEMNSAARRPSLDLAKRKSNS